MPILATGKKETGYTLLEILGVIVLVGLVLALVTPDFSRTEESLRVRYIGKLIKIDLEQAKNEAQTGQNHLKINFTSHGYQFVIGDRLIDRNFQGDNLLFVCGDSEAPPELIFEADGSCVETVIAWETRKYRGELLVKNDGAVSWSYEAK